MTEIEEGGSENLVGGGRTPKLNGAGASVRPRTVSVRQRKAPFCDGHHIPRETTQVACPLFEIASAARRGWKGASHAHI
jgi:hypothetical protein